MFVKQAMLPCMVCSISLVVFACVVRAKDGALSFEQRVRNTIERGTWIARRGFTNEHKVREEFYRLVKAATAESLRRPTVGACWYWPQAVLKDGKVQARINWIEDRPSLTKVTFRNPDLEKTETVTIPQSSLNHKLAHEMETIWYGEIVEISADLIGKDRTQALEVFAEGQEVPATCYPSTSLDLDGETSKTK